MESSAYDQSVLGLAARDDGAVLPGGDGEVVVTTDSHVVDPPTFPGGDLGTLAVAGTVNDLAVMGATDPLGLTVGLVVEAGTEIATLEGIVDSMRAACERASCPVVAGDTKVMGSGEVDGVVVNTTGVGRVSPGAYVPGTPRPGDAVVVSGTVGDHGIALLSEREGFDFETPLESDVAPVNDLAAAALSAGDVTAMTDPTRGGFATALHELLDGVVMVIDEGAVPVDGTVASAGELLGIDPMTVACEGRFVATVAPEDAEAVVAALREFDRGADAAVVGRRWTRPRRSRRPRHRTRQALPPGTERSNAPADLLRCTNSPSRRGCSNGRSRWPRTTTPTASTA
nr:hydrogenase expression/formation protein HypE [Halapricum sp. CBA1109]